MTDALLKSVTRENEQDVRSGGVFYFRSGPGWGGADLPIPPTPPRYGTAGRDQVLRATIHAEDMWATAIGKAISKMVALPWQISDSGKSMQRIKRCQDLFLFADFGRGWAIFLSKHLRDYLTTDNGAVVEIIRATGARGARILGIAHLDSCRVRRTGDVDFPAIYTSLRGREHILRSHQVAFLTDMPDPSDSMFGVGLCAASRAYATIYKMAGLEQYVTEKITGGGQNAIHIIRGITDKQLEDALISHAAERTRAGFVNYKGQVLIPQMTNMDINIATIDLAGIPDGFNSEEERNNTYIKYANAIGIPVQDIQPLNGKSLGTGKQTEILDESGDRQGLASWQTQWIHFSNNDLFPQSTTTSFPLNDLRNEKAKAEMMKLRAEARAAMISDGTITPQQALQMAVDAGDVPREFITVDQTEGQQLADDEKPVGVSADNPDEAAPEAKPEEQIEATKARAYPAALERLIERLQSAIEEDTTALALGQIEPGTWQEEVARLIERYTAAAWKAGQQGAALTKPDIAAVKGLVSTQVEFLNNFTIEIQNADEWQAGWEARAQMYAESIKAPYWRGATKMLPLPAMPTEGTQCLTRCKCIWDVVTVDEEAEDYDAYWRRGAGDSCQTCKERAAQWSPLQIRGGVLQ